MRKVKKRRIVKDGMDKEEMKSGRMERIRKKIGGEEEKEQRIGRIRRDKD
jgi:hypothetical protein